MHLNRSPTGVPPVQGREGEREKFPFGVFVLVTTAGRPALVRPDGWAAGAGEARRLRSGAYRVFTRKRSILVGTVLYTAVCTRGNSSWRPGTSTLHRGTPRSTPTSKL